MKKQACFARRCIQLKQREDILGMSLASKRHKSDLDASFQKDLSELEEVRQRAFSFLASAQAPFRMVVSYGDTFESPCNAVHPVSFRCYNVSQVDLSANINKAFRTMPFVLPAKRPVAREADGFSRARTVGLKGHASSGATSGRIKSPNVGTKGESGKKRGSLQRCGQCVPCTRADCGQCQNCLDKPKFGGPGLRKQACEKKRCLTMTTRYTTPSPPADAVAISNSNKSDSPTGAEKLVPPSTMGPCMASAWTLQLGQLEQLSRSGATAPLPALRSTMASGLGYSLSGGLESNSLLGGTFGAIGGAMGSIGGMGSSLLGGHGLGSLTPLAAANGPAAAMAAVSNTAQASLSTVTHPAPRNIASSDAPFPRRPALEAPENSFTTTDSHPSSFGGLAEGPSSRGWDEPADDANEIVVEEDYNSWLADDF